MIDACPGAALLIDAHAAVVVAANAAGWALLHAAPTSQLALDGAMPAIATLRTLQRDGSGAAEDVSLVFWTEGGVRTVLADVEACAADNGTALLLVCIVKGTRESPSAGSAARDVPGPASPRRIDLAQLAHELKTPLSAIAAASEIMKEGRFGPIGNERYAGYVADIHHSARHALDLIARMLDRKIEQADDLSAAFLFGPIDLSNLVGACLSSVGPLAAAKGLSLVRPKDAATVFVTADETAVKQIVLNLLTNAIKFTPRGGQITLETTRGRSGAVTLTVEDTGPGMTANEIAQALRPVPLEVPPPREGGGLGLGLPLSRSLAQAMGAQLNIESAPGRGVRATLMLPAPAQSRG